MTTVRYGQRQRWKGRKGTTRRALGMSALAALALGLPTVSASAQSAGSTTTTAASTTAAATTTTASPTATSTSTTASPSTTIAPAAASAQANADAAARDIRDLALEIRSLDGTGNNQRHSGWGAAGTIYLRRASASYADGRAAMVQGPNARYISNRIFNDSGQNVFSLRGATQWVWTWGQFLDHTFGLRQDGGESGCRSRSTRAIHSRPSRTTSARSTSSDRASRQVPARARATRANK